MSFLDKLKQKIWRMVYPVFPFCQKALLNMGLIWHEKGRQRYHIGWLAPGKNLEDLKLHLHTKWGFGNHFVAWTDEGQVLSWRKLDGFHEQYHLRVFNDGEIRGHYELTPEAHPIGHFGEEKEQFRRQEFLRFLGDFVTETKYISSLSMDPNAFNPDSEISLENKN